MPEVPQESAEGGCWSCECVLVLRTHCGGMETEGAVNPNQIPQFLEALAREKEREHGLQLGWTLAVIVAGAAFWFVVWAVAQ